jgi:2-hydroxychromene-2-carboxylate isomerase
MKTVSYYFTPASPWTYVGHARFVEMAKRHGATVRLRPVDLGRVFPVSGGLPLAKRASQRQAYRLHELGLAGAVMRACWAEERDISDTGAPAAIVAAQGLDAAALAARADEAAAAYDTYPADAVEQQVFGAPWYQVGDTPFWGQDRLEFVDRALARG